MHKGNIQAGFIWQVGRRVTVEYNGFSDFEKIKTPL